MNDTALSKILSSLLDRPVAYMTDQQLARWLKACEVMERKPIPVNARKSWTTRRIEVDAEIRRRKALDAEAREETQSPHLRATV